MQEGTFIISFVKLSNLAAKSSSGFISHAHTEVLVKFQTWLLRKGQEICLFLQRIFSALASEEQ